MRKKGFTTQPDIARVYLYTTQTNDAWLTKEAGRVGVSKSTFLDTIITEARKNKFSLIPIQVRNVSPRA